MRNIRAIAVSVVCLMSVALSTFAASRWEHIKSDMAIEIVDDLYINVESKDGFIYVACSQPTDVKVFSIVGQLISQARLQPGISRLKMNSRGLYIVKIGEKTLRVTL